MQLVVIHENPLVISEILQSPKPIAFHVAYALSGAEGIQLAKDTTPDLIIIAAKLPDVDGAEICRKIQSDTSLSQSMVILLDDIASGTNDISDIDSVCLNSPVIRSVPNRQLPACIQTMLKIKSVQQDLLASEKRFFRMYENIPIPFLILNDSGDIVSVNPAWEKQIGRQLTEVVGTSFFDILPTADADKLRSYLSTRQASESPPDIELNVCRKDGSLSRMLFNSFQETDLPGKNGHSFCTLYGAPHKASVHDSLLKTQQLEFTATLAGGIAHDFNNLLMSIMGNISLAQLFLNPEDKSVKILQRAEATCNEGKELTHQFIILSKCGYPTKKPSSILKLLKDATVLENPDPKIKVLTDIPNDCWKINVDEYQIKYVLSHLMTNAGESMPNGGKISITVRNIISSGKPPLPDHPISSGCFLNIRITDAGKGIPSEHLPRIFDPYYTTKEMGPRKGMGLGLTTVYSIVHKHDGFIFIESEVDRGTTVNIYLPAIPE